MCRPGATRLLGLFRLAEWPKAPNKEYELPAVTRGLRMGIAPGGHARELHTVLDDVVDLAVTEMLGCEGAQIGHSGIEIQAHFCPAAPVDSMTCRALDKKGFPALLEGIRSRRYWVFLIPLASGNGKRSHGPRQPSLPYGRHRGSSEDAADQQEAAGSPKDYDYQKCKEKRFQCFHAGSGARRWTLGSATGDP